MSESDQIVCRPTNWVKIRGVLILLMLGVFAFLFYKDGKIGYREKNLHYFVHSLMTEQAPAIANDSEKEFDVESWKVFAEGKSVVFPESSKGPIPESAEGMKWPAELADNFAAVKEGNNEAVKLWKDYAKREEWDQKPVEQPYDQGQINTQFYFAYGCAAMFVVVLFFFLRILSRKMVVTDEAFFAPGAKKIAFSDMRKIDKRKWDVKGIADIFYDEGGVTKKAKVDGMVYGQFKKDDGEPAERLFAKIMENFKGEVVEYEETEEEEEVKEGV